MGACDDPISAVSACMGVGPWRPVSIHWKRMTLLFLTTTTGQCLLSMGRGLESISLIYMGILVGLTFASSCADKHSCCDHVSSKAIPYPEDSTAQHSSGSSGEAWNYSNYWYLIKEKIVQQNFKSFPLKFFVILFFPYTKFT